MVIPDEGGTVRFTQEQIITALVLYLREIHGVPIGRLESASVPVYDQAGNVGATVTLRAKR